MPSAVGTGFDSQLTGHSLSFPHFLSLSCLLLALNKTENAKQSSFCLEGGRCTSFPWTKKGINPLTAHFISTRPSKMAYFFVLCPCVWNQFKMTWPLWQPLEDGYTVVTEERTWSVTEAVSYFRLPINSKQAGHSPPTSDINKVFSTRKVLITGYFVFFTLSSINHRDGYYNFFY